jgi:hypothetical protein
MPSRRELLAVVLLLGIGVAWIGGAGRVMAQGNSDYAPPDPVYPFPLLGLWPLKQNHLAWPSRTSTPTSPEHCVRFDVRIVCVPASLHERLKEDFPLDGTRGIQCNEREAHALLEAVQSDPNASIVSPPIMELLPAQAETVKLGQQEKFLTGVRVVSKQGKPTFEPVHSEVPTMYELTLKGTPKNEGKSVEVELTVNVSRIERVETMSIKLPVGEKGEEVTQTVQCPHVSRNTLARTVTIPADATAVLPGWWEQGQTPEVPVVNGAIVAPKESQRVIVLLSARTIR